MSGLRMQLLGGLALGLMTIAGSAAVARDLEVWTSKDIETLRKSLTADAMKSPGGSAGKQIRNEANYRLALNVSTRSGGAEQHDGWTDEIRVVTGEIDFVSGGTIEGLKPGGADGEFRGTALTGATVTHRLRAGDIVEVPAGTPHQTKVVKGPVTTLVYKVR